MNKPHKNIDKKRDSQKVIATVLLLMMAYSIYSWLSLILSPLSFSEYLQRMNENSALFSEKTLYLHAISTTIIHCIGLVGSALVIANVDVGKKIMLLSIIAWSMYNTGMLVHNIITNMSVGLYIMNILIGVGVFFLFKKFFFDNKLNASKA